LHELPLFNWAVWLGETPLTVNCLADEDNRKRETKNERRIKLERAEDGENDGGVAGEGSWGPEG
jgi:hypothetical protein